MPALFYGIRMCDNAGTFYGTHCQLCLGQGGGTI